MRPHHSRSIAVARSALCLLLAGLALSLAVADDSLTNRQRENWIPEKSLPQILAKHPKAIVMTSAEYLALVKDAAIPNAPTIHEPPIAASILSAAYKGSLIGDLIMAEAVFEIDCLANPSNTWHVLDLPIDVTTLGTVKLDKETALNVISEKDPADQNAAKPRCTVLLRSPGRHTLTASFYIPIHESATGKRITLPSPKAPIARFSLVLPERYVLRSEENLLISSSKPAKGNITHDLPLPFQDPDITLHWRSRDIAPLEGGAVLQVCSYLYQIDPVHVTSDLGIVLRSAVARVPERVTIPLPQAAKLISIDGPDLLAWTLEQNSINLTFSSKDLRETSLRIVLETSPSTLPTPPHDLTAELPQPSVQGVHRAAGSFAIVADSNVRVRDISTAGLTVQTTEGLPGNAAQQPGFVAGFSFPGLAAAPTITFQKLEPRFQTDQLVSMNLRRDSIELRRTFRIIVKEGEIFSTRIKLPAAEETTSVTLANGVEPKWTSNAGAMEITWPTVVTATAPATVTVVTRIDPEEWFTLGEKPRRLSFAAATVDGPELTTGYVGLNFDERFKVSTVSSTGLEPTDPIRLAPLGLDGRLTWALAESYTLELDVSRRPSEVHADITAYALPLLHTCEIEGQIDLEVLHSGVRELLVTAPPDLAQHLRFDSPLIAERKLQPDTGAWTITFHEELNGHSSLRYHWSLPFSKPDATATEKQSVGQRFALSLPVLNLPEASRVTGTWIVEANTDTELTITPKGLDDRDTLALPTIDNYTPRHRVIAAYGWRGTAWQLALEGTRHPIAPLPGLVIDSLDIRTIVNSDNSQRHQLSFQLRSNGVQFFQCPLPAEARILGLTLDAKAIKPVADPALLAQKLNGLRVQLPATVDARPAQIQLTYELPAPTESFWRSSGKVELAPPAIKPDIPVLSVRWMLHLPDGYTYSHFSGNLRKDFEQPTKSLLGALGGQPTTSDLPAISHQPQAAADRINQLQQELDSQNKKVEEKRIAMLNIMKKHEIIGMSGAHPKFSGLTGSVSNGKDETYKQMMQQLAAYEIEVSKLKAQLQALSSIADEDQLIEQAAAMGLPIPTLKEFLPRYHNAKLDLNKARNGGLGGDHPTVKDLNAPVEVLKGILKDAVRAHQKSLATQITIAETSLKALSDQRDSEGKELVESEPGQSEYQKAKTEYVQEFAQLNEMRQKLSSAQLNTPNPAPASPPGPTTTITPKMPPPLFTGTPLPLPTVRPSETPPPPALKPAAGLIPLEIALPETGRTFAFSGNHLPGPITLQFSTWTRNLRIAIFNILLAAAAAWFLARRRPIFVGLIVGLILHFTPEIFGPQWQTLCNSLLLGWGGACLLIWIFRRLTRHRLTTAALLAFGLHGLTPTPATAAEEAASIPAGHTVYVPFDSTKPLLDQKPGRYFLTYETFQTLWAQAKENKLNAANPTAPEDDSKPWAVFQSALYQATIADQRLLIDATLTLQSSGAWAAVELNFAGASLGALTLDGAPAPLTDGKLLVEKPGVHILLAKLEIPLTANWEKAGCSLPAAAASFLSLTLSDMSSRIKINNDLPTVETASGEGKPTRTITAALGSGQALAIARHLGTHMANQAQKPPASANVSSALFLSPALQRIESSISYHFPDADRQEFALEMDASLTPISFEIPNLESWKLTQDKESKTLTFRLSLPTRDSLKLKFTGERSAAPAPGKEQFPRIRPKAARLEQEYLLLAVDELEIKPQPAASHAQADFPAEFPGDIGFQRIGCFRATGNAAPLPYATALRLLTLSMQADYLYQLSPSKMETHAIFNLIPARGQDLLQTSARLPKGFTVTRVDSDRLQDWWVDGERLHVRFSGHTPEVTTLLLGLANAWKAPPDKLQFSPIELENVGSVKGRGQIASPPDVSVDLSFGNQPTTSIRETGASERLNEYPAVGGFKLTSPFLSKRHFTFDSKQFEGTLTLGKIPAKFDTRWVMAAEIWESWTRVETLCDLEVKAGALSEFTIALPASALTLGDPRITGEAVREVTKLPAEAPDAPARFKIALQRPITSAVKINIALEIPHTGQIQLPDLTFPESGINQRFLVVQNSSSGEVHLDAKRSARVEPLAARDVEKELHFIIKNFAQPIYYRAGEDWRLGMKLERLATTTGTKALVLYAELTTALRTNGEEWLTADYRLQNRSLQFLPVRLPERFELISATVDQQPVRADLGEKDSLPVLLIPLIQTKPGDLALQVQLVCRKLPASSGTPGSQLQLALDDPELPGITIERTVWRVALPEGYEVKDTEGNMERVQDQVAGSEKYSAAISEISQLLRLATSFSALREKSSRNAKYLSDQIKYEWADKKLDLPDQQLKQLESQIATLESQTATQAAQPVQPVSPSEKKSANWQWDNNGGYIKTREANQNSANQKEQELVKQNLGLNANVVSGNGALFGKYNITNQKPTAKHPVNASKPNSRYSAVDKLVKGEGDDDKNVRSQIATIDAQRSLESAKQPSKSSSPEAKPEDSNAQSITRSKSDFTLSYQNTTNRHNEFWASGGDKIAQLIQLGSGFADLGQYNEAEAKFKEVLKLDPSNGNARRNLERVQNEKSGFASATRDHSRQAKLNQVDAQWESPLPETIQPLLRPAGRVSLPVALPLTTPLTHFKKIKAQAIIKISASPSSPPGRHPLRAGIFLTACLAVLWFYHTIQKRRSIRAKNISQKV